MTFFSRDTFDKSEADLFAADVAPDLAAAKEDLAPPPAPKPAAPQPASGGFQLPSVSLPSWDDLSGMADRVVRPVTDAIGNAGSAAASAAGGLHLPSWSDLTGEQPASNQTPIAGGQTLRDPSQTLTAGGAPVAMPQGSSVPQAGSLEEYARRKAASLGIDPDIAARVGQSEGGFDDPTRQSDVIYQGQREQSYGPYQLNVNGGLGSAALQRGIDPRKPEDAYRAIDFALEDAARNGWGAFHGAARVGIGPWDGIGVAAQANTPSPQANQRINPQPVAMPQGGQPSAYAPGELTPNQINAATAEGMDYETALAVCGPAAAIAFARRNGRNPSMQEALALAKDAGWTAGSGMAGPESEQRLLQSMGVAARLQSGRPSAATVAADVSRGNPVIVSTPGHYFVAERYDPDSGAFDFGQSAAVLKAAGGRHWFTLDELPSLGMGAPTASLFMDSPDSPSPSVVAGRSDMQRLPLADTTQQDTPNDPDQGPHETGYRLPPGTSVPIRNADGSVTTERSITVTDPRLNNGLATNIPSVWGGMIQNEDDAVDYAVRSGRPWPSFRTIKQAEQAARRRSNDLGTGSVTSVGGASGVGGQQPSLLSPSVVQATTDLNRSLTNDLTGANGDASYRLPLATGGPDTVPDTVPDAPAEAPAQQQPSLFEQIGSRITNTLDTGRQGLSDVGSLLLPDLSRPGRFVREAADAIGIRYRPRANDYTEQERGQPVSVLDPGLSTKDDLGNALQRGTYETRVGTLRAVGEGARVLGMPDVADIFDNDANHIEDARLNDPQVEHRARKGVFDADYLVSPLGVAEGIAESAPSLLPTLLGAALTGGGSTLARVGAGLVNAGFATGVLSSAGQTLGDMADEVKAGKMSQATADTLAVGSGLVEYLTEKMFPGADRDLINGMGKETLERFASELRKHGLMGGLKEVGKETFQEGAEEVVAEAYSVAVDSVFSSNKPTLAQAAERIASAGLIGAASGAALSGPMTIGEAIADRGAREHVGEDLKGAGRGLAEEGARQLMGHTPQLNMIQPGQGQDAGASGSTRSEDVGTSNADPLTSVPTTREIMDIGPRPFNSPKEGAWGNGNMAVIDSEPIGVAQHAQPMGQSVRPTISKFVSQDRTPADVVARVTVSDTPMAVLRSSDGKETTVDARYVNYLEHHFPDASWQIGSNNTRLSPVARVNPDGKAAAIVMPLNVEGKLAADLAAAIHQGKGVVTNATLTAPAEDTTPAPTTMSEWQRQFVDGVNRRAAAGKPLTFSTYTKAFTANEARNGPRGIEVRTGRTKWDTLTDGQATAMAATLGLPDQARLRIRETGARTSAPPAETSQPQTQQPAPQPETIAVDDITRPQIGHDPVQITNTQADQVAAELRQRFPGHEVNVHRTRTEGKKGAQVRIAKPGGTISLAVDNAKGLALLPQAEATPSGSAQTTQSAQTATYTTIKGKKQPVTILGTEPKGTRVRFTNGKEAVVATDRLNTEAKPITFDQPPPGTVRGSSGTKFERAQAGIKNGTVSVTMKLGEWEGWPADSATISFPLSAWPEDNVGPAGFERRRLIRERLAAAHTDQHDQAGRWDRLQDHAVRAIDEARKKLAPASAQERPQQPERAAQTPTGQEPAGPTLDGMPRRNMAAERAAGQADFTIESTDQERAEPARGDGTKGRPFDTANGSIARALGMVMEGQRAHFKLDDMSAEVRNDFSRRLLALADQHNMSVRQQTDDYAAGRVSIGGFPRGVPKGWRAVEKTTESTPDSVEQRGSVESEGASDAGQGVRAAERRGSDGADRAPLAGQRPAAARPAAEGGDAARVSPGHGGSDRAAGAEPPAQRARPVRGVGSGDARGRAEPVASTLSAPSPSTAGHDYVMSARDLAETSPARRFDGNLDALDLLAQLGTRHATPEQQALLARYSGFGDSEFNPAFPAYGKPQDGVWARRRERLEQALGAILGDEEQGKAALRSIERSRRNAHFTTPEVVRAMWDAADRLGIAAINRPRILEPSAGSGRFLGLMPADLAARSQRSAVELDTVTGKLLEKLFPNADVQVTGFQDAVLPNESFDLVISNVPFADTRVNDRTIKMDVLKGSVHNYFFAKALQKVRPGGVIAFITTHYTLDAKAATPVRRYIAQQAELLGAIRLPQDAFPDTAVTTDVIFLRKYGPDEDAPASPPAWTETVDKEESIGQPGYTYSRPYTISRYFDEHPEMALGRHTTEGGRGQYGAAEYRLVKDDRDVVADLNRAVARLPEGVIKPAATEDTSPRLDLARAPTGTKEGAYIVDKGRLVVNRGGRPELVTLSKDDRARVFAQLGLRDAAKDVLNLQLEGASNLRVQAAQRKLGKLYDDFTATHGPLNALQNRKLMAEDPDGPFLRALERWGEQQAKTLKGPIAEQAARDALKMPIFRDRVVRPATPVEHAEHAEDAVAIVLNENGRLIWDRVARLLGRDVEGVQHELAEKGLIYRNPEADAWETADQYLSGNVREKLRVAEAAAAGRDDQYRPNVEALKAVQPRTLEPSEIEVRLGTHWIDAADREAGVRTSSHDAFFHHLLGARAAAYRGDQQPMLRYIPQTSEWSLGQKVGLERAKESAYSTKRVDADKIFLAALNGKQITVWDEDAQGNKSKNAQASLEADQVGQRMRDEFKRWVWDDGERAGRLADFYNEHYNNLRPRQYDGSHLTLPGSNPGITLREHQKDAVWRIIQDGTALLAHEVGFGKTYTMIAAGMELRRLGLAKKNVYVVLDHMVEQFARDFRQLYPTANLLVPEKGDFGKDRRPVLTSKIATGDWDGVILTKTQFAMLPVRPETEERFIQEQISDLIAAIFAEEQAQMASGSRGKSRTQKQLQKSIDNLESKLEGIRERMSAREDKTLAFEDLGVDTLFADEADIYKNLFFATRMSRVKGLSNTNSQRALGMQMKSRHLLRRQGGRGVVFATGTPVSNSIAELWTMLRYLSPDTLHDLNIDRFDAWASQFGEVTTSAEQSVTGKYQLVNRFARFVNVPELSKLFQQVADVRMSEDLPEMEAQKPRLVGSPDGDGKRIVAVSQPSPELTAYIKAIAKRKADLRLLNDPTVDNDLKIASDARKASLDIRLIPEYADLPPAPDGKVAQAVDNIHQVWRDTAADKGAQLVFLDLSTPKVRPDSEGDEETIVDDETGEERAAFQSVYAEIKRGLIERGIPEAEVRFIHDAKTKEQRQALYNAVNAGRVRVLLGSTEKLGAGTNVQERLAALHHMDAPWRPRDIEQREGRILRPGNMVYGPEVERLPDGSERVRDRGKGVRIYQYVTEGSYDGVMWQAIEAKARAIKSIMRRDVTTRFVEEADEFVVSMAQAKALASGDPDVLKLFEYKSELAKLEAQRSSFTNAQARARTAVTKIPGQIRRLHAELAEKRAAQQDRLNEGKAPSKIIARDIASLDHQIEQAGQELEGFKAQVGRPFEQGRRLKALEREVARLESKLQAETDEQKAAVPKANAEDLEILSGKAAPEPEPEPPTPARQPEPSAPSDQIVDPSLPTEAERADVARQDAEVADRPPHAGYLEDASFGTDEEAQAPGQVETPPSAPSSEVANQEVAPVAPAPAKPARQRKPRTKNERVAEALDQLRDVLLDETPAEAAPAAPIETPATPIEAPVVSEGAPGAAQDATREDLGAEPPSQSTPAPAPQAPAEPEPTAITPENVGSAETGQPVKLKNGKKGRVVGRTRSTKPKTATTGNTATVSEPEVVAPETDVAIVATEDGEVVRVADDGDEGTAPPPSADIPEVDTAGSAKLLDETTIGSVEAGDRVRLDDGREGTVRSVWESNAKGRRTRTVNVSLDDGTSQRIEFTPTRGTGSPPPAGPPAGPPAPPTPPTGPNPPGPPMDGDEANRRLYEAFTSPTRKKLDPGQQRHFLERWRRNYVRAMTDNKVDLNELIKDLEGAYGGPLPDELRADLLSRLSPGMAAKVRIDTLLRPFLRGLSKEQLAWLDVYLTHTDNLDVARSVGQKVEARVAGQMPDATAADQKVQQAKATLNGLRLQHSNAVSAGDDKKAAHYAGRIAKHEQEIARREKHARAALARAQAKHVLKAQKAGEDAAKNRLFSEGLTVQDSQDGISSMAAALGLEKMDEIRHAAEGVWAFTRFLLDMKHRAGVIPTDVHQALVNRYPHYVPTRILDYMGDPTTDGPPVGQSLSLNDNGLKRVSDEGTRRSRENPLASVYRYAFETERIVKQQAVFSAMHGLIQTIPELQAEFREAPQDHTLNKSRKEAYVAGYVDGVRTRYVTGERMAEAIQIIQASPIPHLFTRFMHVFKEAITRMPKFIAYQAVLDPMSALARMYSDNSGNPLQIPTILSDMAVGYGTAFRGLLSGEYKGDAAKMMLAGAGMTGFNARDAEARKAAVYDLTRRHALDYNILKPSDLLKLGTKAATFEWSQAIGERFEMAPRVAAYRNAKRRTGSELQATIAARDVTLDFQRGGYFAKTLNGLMAFFNVGAQASATLPRMWSANPLGFVVMSAAFIGVAALIESMLGNDDDWQDVPPYIRDRGFLFPTGGVGTDEEGDARPRWYMLPVRELAPILIPAREAIRRAMGKEGRTPLDLLTSTLMAASPIQGDSAGQVLGGLIPELLATPFELAFDKDLFRGSQIATRRNDERASNTSQALTAFANWIGGLDENLSALERVRPSQIEHLIRGYGGHAASDALAGIDRLTGERDKGQQDRGPIDTLAVGDLVGRFVVDQTGGRLQQARDPNRLLAPDLQRSLKAAHVTVGVGPVRDTIEGVPLRTHEQAMYQELANRYTNNELRQLLPDLPTMSPADREKAVVKAITTARNQARSDVLDRIPNADQRTKKAS